MKSAWKSALLQCLAMAIALALVFPILYGFLGAFKRPDEFARFPPSFWPERLTNLENFRQVFKQAPMLRYFANSAATATLTALVRLLLAVLGAYAVTYFDFRFKRAFFLLILGTMMLPADTLMVTNYQTVARLRLTDTFLGMSIVSFVGASQMFMLRQHFRTAPRALRDAAMLDGCGDLSFLFRVLIPESRAILLTLFLQAFIAQWNAYLWPLLVTNHDGMRTVQVGIAMLAGPESTNYEIVLAGAALAMIPSLILYALLRRHITSAMSDGPLAGDL